MYVYYQRRRSVLKLGGPGHPPVLHSPLSSFPSHRGGGATPPLDAALQASQRVGLLNTQLMFIKPLSCFLPVGETLVYKCGFILCCKLVTIKINGWLLGNENIQRYLSQIHITTESIETMNSERSELPSSFRQIFLVVGDLQLAVDDLERQMIVCSYCSKMRFQFQLRHYRLSLMCSL